MRKLNAKPLTADAFRKYGTYSRMINPDGERLGPPPVEFYRDLVHVNLGSGIPCASVTRVSPRPMIAEKFEYHTATAEDTPVHILVFLPERTYANDCSVVLFPEEEKLELEG